MQLTLERHDRELETGLKNFLLFQMKREKLNRSNLVDPYTESLVGGDIDCKKSLGISRHWFKKSGYGNFQALEECQNHTQFDRSDGDRKEAVQERWQRGKEWPASGRLARAALGVDL